MRLYTRVGATALDHPVFGHFEADPDGGFDFPNELSSQIHGFAVGGRQLWETDVERQNRRASEELDRRRDPATLWSAVQDLVTAAGQVSVAKQRVAEPAAPAEPTAPVEDEDGDEGTEDAPVVEKAPRAPRKTAASRRAKAE